MRAHYLQHVPFEGLGNIKEWLTAKKYKITSTSFDQPEAGKTLPDPAEVNLLIIMGGPMSVNEEDKYPWLAEEKQFIRAAIEQHVPVLGICLGAQLIASAMGSRVYANGKKEIGWWPVKGRMIEEGVYQFPERLDVFHWHGETFDLPKGAVLLASSAGCANQAFQLGRTVMGLQFHLETTPSAVRALVDNCRDELAMADFIQTEEEMMAASRENYEEIQQEMKRILGYLASARR